jgi:hypothetical protein
VRVGFCCSTLVIVLFSSVIAANGPTSIRITSGPSAKAQWCVNRWNQMKMGWPPADARIVTQPRCRIVLSYSFKRDSTGCGSAMREGKWCIDHRSGFVCALNRFGAFTCPTHASAVKIAAWNAAVDRNAVLRLRAPLVNVDTPTPAWAQRYPFSAGFIRPWTREGRLRAGLSLRGSVHASCDGWSERASANGAKRCLSSSQNRLWDPCFPEPQHRNRFACSRAPGDTVFVRVLVS